MNCRICGEGPVRTKWRKGAFEILQCPVCGLAFWEPDSDFDPARIYGHDYFSEVGASGGYDDYAGQEASLRTNFADRLSRIPRRREGARLLDVGAAFGFSVSEASLAGWHAAGVEVSPEAAGRAARHAPGRVIVADGLRLPWASDSFDAVTMWDVLEHLPEPKASIAEVGRVLSPGGHLALTTGDVASLAARLSGPRWHLYNLPEHLFFYTRKSLRILLEDQGFEVLSIRAEASHYTLGYLVERLRKSLLGRGPTARPRWPGARLRVPMNLFDVVTVRAVWSGRSG